MDILELEQANILQYHGSSPFSLFYLEKLLNSFKKNFPQVDDIIAEYRYFAYVNPPLEDHEEKILQQILDAKSQSNIETGNLILVLSRFGTISPWSSKATDILHVCGMQKIQRVERGISYYLKTKGTELSLENLQQISQFLFDRMTEVAVFDVNAAKKLFQLLPPKPEKKINILEEGPSALITANTSLGLALKEDDITFLYHNFLQLQRNPSYAELMMFAQVNSEHCRHKIFNARWIIDAEEKPESLFSMIKHTYQQNPEGVLSAYHDNGAILQGPSVKQFYVDTTTKKYTAKEQAAHIVIKVETHNHPTAISPFAGAATGSGGEIRDEGATGIGAKPKAGLTGFTVSHLYIPDFPQPWEVPTTWSSHSATSLKIMLEGPIGAASFNNEFGRPNICGYFRTFTQLERSEKNHLVFRGYHKPIMLAGGLGNIRPQAIAKKKLPVGTKIIVLGGPSMLIGLGGGAISSLMSGNTDAMLDFSSVQRSNPEMQRRAQEVLNACFALEDNNPILSIHDVGAGGLSNALPELVNDQGVAARFDLRAIPVAESDMSAMEIWCNESQERYVLAISPQDVDFFAAIALRERCPFAVIGEVTDDLLLEVFDSLFQDTPVQMPVDILFPSRNGKLVKTKRMSGAKEAFTTACIDLNEAIERVLQFPCVANKSFLVTIGDRSVTGLVVRDQMIGPWQVPVADVAVTANSFTSYRGEAMAMGERSPVAILDAKAAARLCVAEAITNILAADIESISDIKLSANWMAAADYENDAVDLFEAVQTIAKELCPKLGICIPVGKDSLSMQMQWQTDAVTTTVVAPLSLIISAFSPVKDVRKTLTPLLVTDEDDTGLLLIDLGQGKNRLGGSVLTQVFQSLGDMPADLDDANLLLSLFQAMTKLRQENLLLAYHDRSDGGVLTSLCEMAFASHVGITIHLEQSRDDVISALFNEEVGVIIQVRRSDKIKIFHVLEECGLINLTHSIAHLNTEDAIIIEHNGQEFYRQSRIHLQRVWTETSYRMQALRDNPVCAKQEFDKLLDAKDKGLNVQLTFDLNETIQPPNIAQQTRPEIAILREQGVNGHVEMAGVFHQAGFECTDVHMSDIHSGKVRLEQFKGLVACGGFSYGDVLGAGRGWATSIALNARAYDQFSDFFHRSDTFTLGVCNGCQMLAYLQDMIPGSELWPHFKQNLSEQFESRLTLVRISPSPSLFFMDMVGSQMPVVVAHGEGRAVFNSDAKRQQLVEQQLTPLHYVNSHGIHTENYPDNPNGSPIGIAAVTNKDGRVTLMMPHPERVFRAVQHSWHPKEWQENGPWLRIFQNARKWVD